MKLEKLSVNELTELKIQLDLELEERRQIEVKSEYNKRIDCSKKVLKNIDALLELVEHDSYSKCSDSERNNSNQCNRCTLLNIKILGWCDFEYKVSVTVEYEPLEVPKG